MVADEEARNVAHVVHGTSALAGGISVRPSFGQFVELPIPGIEGALVLEGPARRG
jgi:hypothetical protein